jgi:hypothetical protein
MSLIRYQINSMTVDLTISKAIEAPKVFQLKKTLGEKDLVKLVSAIIKAFCDSVKASRTMDAVDILECAEMIIKTYTHESVKEVMYALKAAKTKGFKSYNQLDAGAVFEIINNYMDEKARFLENEHHDRISANDGSVWNENSSKAVAEERKQDAEERRKHLQENSQSARDKKEIEAIKKIVDTTVKNQL